MTIPGQGGQPSRPQNAPPPGTVAYGIQPGTQQVFRRLIVAGPGGASASGLFIYNPSIAPGNLIISASAGGTGPEGESLGPGVIAYGPGPTGPETSRVGFTVIGGVPALGFSSGAASETRSAQITEQVNSPNTTNEQIQINFFGPQGGGVSPNDSVIIALVSSTAASPGVSTGLLRFIDTSGASHDTAFWGQHGFTGAIVQTLTGAQPGTINTTLAAETWHTMSGFGTGWSAGTPTPQYRYEPIGSAGLVRLRGQVLSTAAEAANSAIFTLPAGYHPSVAATFLTPSTTGTLTAGSLAVTTGGVIQQNTATAGAGAVIFLDGVTFPLD